MERYRTYLQYLLVFVALGCTTAGADLGDLVEDGNFDLSTPPGFSTYWVATGDPAGESYVESRRDADDDYFALFAEGDADPRTVSLTQSGLGLEAGTIYDVSFDLSIISEGSESDEFWVYLGGDPTPVYYWTNDIAASYPSEIPLQTIERQGISVGLATFDDVIEFRCRFDGLDPLTYITVDNVSVVPVPLPPSVVLAGLGMASCAFGGGMARCKSRFLGRKRDKLA